MGGHVPEKEEVSGPWPVRVATPSVPTRVVSQLQVGGIDTPSNQRIDPVLADVEGHRPDARIMRAHSNPGRARLLHPDGDAHPGRVEQLPFAMTAVEGEELIRRDDEVDPVPALLGQPRSRKRCAVTEIGEGFGDEGSDLRRRALPRSLTYT